MKKQYWDYACFFNSEKELLSQQQAIRFWCLFSIEKHMSGREFQKRKIKCSERWFPPKKGDKCNQCPGLAAGPPSTQGHVKSGQELEVRASGMEPNTNRRRKPEWTKLKTPIVSVEKFLCCALTDISMKWNQKDCSVITSKIC